MTMLRKALLLLLGLSLAAANPVQADSTAPFLWEVKGPQATHYLLGSVHLLPKSASDLPDGISDAYDAAEGLVFESDIGALNGPKTFLTMLSGAKTARGLKLEVDPLTYLRAQSRAAELKVPPEYCKYYKAWLCALTLEVFAYQKAGFSGEHGLDRQLYDFAKADSKRIGWFESPDVHLDLFKGMSDTLGKQLLTAALSREGATGDEPADMFRAWRDNDTAKIEALVVDMKARYPQIYQRLLATRNHAWAAKLKQYLDGAEPQMIIVGAAHWLGPEGLLTQLKSAGYKIKPYAAGKPDLITATPSGPNLITTAAAVARR